MKNSSKREWVGLGLLFVILGGWFFAAGFERPWTVGHFVTLVILVSGIVILGYALIRR